MTGVLDYPRAHAAGAARVGGKAWNLARLARWGFPVPRAIVIDIEAYDAAMALESVAPLVAKAAAIGVADLGDPAALQSLADIRAGLAEALPTEVLRASLEAAMNAAGFWGKPVAVRSSATGEDGETHAFAGIHESFLNAEGLDAILRAVSQCHASLWTPQAVAYRRRFGIADADVRCAVVVCEMITAPNADEPVAAGVVFTADPTGGRRDRFVVETVPGLGDKLVGGRATPARGHIDLGISELSPLRGDSGALPSAMTASLARLAARVHAAFSDGESPQDIEWAFDGARIVLLQTRPITALRRRTYPEIADQPTIWSNANFKEIVSDVVSPMSWAPSEVWSRQTFFDLHHISGYSEPKGMWIIRRFEGRLYINISAMQYSSYDAWGIPPADTNETFGGFQPVISIPSDPRSARLGLRRGLAKLRLMREIWRRRATLSADIESVEAGVKTCLRSDLRVLSNAELMEFWIAKSWRDWRLPFMLANATGTIWLSLARQVAGRYLAAGEVEPLLGGLMSGQGGVVSAQHAYELRDIVARHGDEGPDFDAAITDWLDKYGHRGFNEIDVASPRWAETPNAIRAFARDLGAATHDPDTARRARKDAEARLAILPFFARRLLAWLMRRTEEGFRLREQSKSALVAIFGVSRHVALAFGDRMAASGILERRDDVFMLTPADILAFVHGDWSGAGARELVSDRREQLKRWRDAEPPADVIFESADAKTTPAPISSVPAKRGGVRQGIAASPGVASGFARKLSVPTDAAALREGGILVARSTDPSWTPLFLSAQGIVVEIGGYLSHGAIVAREFGIPAVVNVRGVFDAIAGGAAVVVDGDRGQVTIRGD